MVGFRDVTLSDVMVTYNADLSHLFSNHTFVGCVDQTRALLQHEVCEGFCKSCQSYLYVIADWTLSSGFVTSEVGDYYN